MPDYIGLLPETFACSCGSQRRRIFLCSTDGPEGAIPLSSGTFSRHRVHPQCGSVAFAIWLSAGGPFLPLGSLQEPRSTVGWAGWGWLGWRAVRLARYERLAVHELHWLPVSMNTSAGGRLLQVMW